MKMTPQPVKKDKEIISLRMDLDPHTSKEFKIIQQWLNSQNRTEVVRFCIHQVYLGLKEGKLSVLRD